jgi:hypothetical protein
VSIDLGMGRIQYAFTEYRQFSGIWFPVHITEQMSAGGRTSTATIQLTSVRVNEGVTEQDFRLRWRRDERDLPATSRRQEGCAPHASPAGGVRAGTAEGRIRPRSPAQAERLGGRFGDLLEHQRQAASKSQRAPPNQSSEQRAEGTEEAD